MVLKKIEDTDTFSCHGQFLKIWLDNPSQKNAQTTTNYFEKKILISSKRKPNLIEADRGKEVFINIFQNFLINNNIKQYS